MPLITFLTGPHNSRCVKPASFSLPRSRGGQCCAVWGPTLCQGWPCLHVSHDVAFLERCSWDRGQLNYRDMKTFWECSLDSWFILFFFHIFCLFISIYCYIFWSISTHIKHFINKFWLLVWAHHYSNGSKPPMMSNAPSANTLFFYFLD